MYRAYITGEPRIFKSLVFYLKELSLSQDIWDNDYEEGDQKYYNKLLDILQQIDETNPKTFFFLNSTIVILTEYFQKSKVRIETRVMTIILTMLDLLNIDKSYSESNGYGTYTRTVPELDFYDELRWFLLNRRTRFSIDEAKDLINNIIMPDNLKSTFFIYFLDDMMHQSKCSNEFVCETAAYISEKYPELEV